MANGAQGGPGNDPGESPAAEPIEGVSAIAKTTEEPGAHRFVSAYTADTVPSANDGRIYAPAAGRNAAAVGDALVPLLKGLAGTLVEIGSGTGQHAAHLAALLPALTWQPTDLEPLHLTSIEAWRHHAGLPNLNTPFRLDATGPWPGDAGVAPLLPLAALFSANVIHIAPWSVAEGMVAGAGQALLPGGRLVLYGPFKEGGQHTGEGNVRFDAALRARDPSHGVRDLDAVAALAAAAGMGPPAITRMPANNLLVAFTKG